MAVNGKEKIIYGSGGVNTQIVQIYMDYSGGLPPVREISLEEIRFFYEPLIEGLCELQKLKREKGK
ncbi:hypothetical protein FACS1894161_2530 [Spirochaetia bacterium]|nr:hypothetical protein FACS1894161_2530 [Spirochaetia bacterium]